MTIKEFAEHAGVSIATVSRAFGGAGRISDRTRRRLLDEADRVGYAPCFTARGLAGRLESTVVFFHPELYSHEADPFFSEIAQGITRSVSRDRIFQIVPFFAQDDANVLSCCNQIRDGRVSGAVIVAEGARAEELAAEARRAHVPYVIVGELDEFPSNSILYNVERGAELAGRHFRNTGRKHAAFVTGHRDERKRRGFLRGFDGDTVIIDGGAGFNFGIRAFEILRREHPEVDCVLCANDVLAAGILRAAASAGVKVPERLSVIGFDDIALAGCFIPSISTVSIHPVRVGEAAVNMLEKQFVNDREVQSEILPCDLVIRESSF